MPDVIFHSMADSAYLWAVIHVADEKGVSHEVAPLILGSPEHLRLHPFAKMPVMQHGNVILYESLAIAHYLDRAFDGPALQPADALGQAHMLRWASIVNAYVFPVMNRFMKERLVKPAWMIEPDLAFVEAARAPLSTQVRLIDEALKAAAFLVGDRLTIADSFLLPHLLFFARTPEGEQMLARTPATLDWLARMMARPSFTGSAMSRAYAVAERLPRPTDLAWPLP